ncbi:MAG: sodium:proton antiporter, partial [Bacteroidales bacterium]|nr:sodium:proton antiporter [Bacteroidales bacterium]
MKQHPLPSPLIAIMPVVVLIILVALSLVLFGVDALSGASQMSLLAAAGFALLLGRFTIPFHWSDFEKQLHRNF